MFDREKETIILTGFARAIVRRKARSMANLSGFRADEVPDIQQDLVIALYESLDQFDPSTGHVNAFITTVIERARAMQIRHRSRSKRTGNVVPLEEEEINRRSRDEHQRAVRRIELKHDLAAALAALPTDLRELALRLKTKSIAEVAREQQLPRSTLMRQVEQLRRHFEKENLQDFL